jgi:hypothetical protein
MQGNQVWMNEANWQGGFILWHTDKKEDTSQITYQVNPKWPNHLFCTRLIPTPDTQLGGILTSFCQKQLFNVSSSSPKHEGPHLILTAFFFHWPFQSLLHCTSC